MKNPCPVWLLLIAFVCTHATAALAQNCNKPLNFNIEDVYDTRAKLRWSANGAVAPLAYWVIYGPKGFQLGSEPSDTLKVTNTKAQITGLKKKTEYDCYVVQQCDTNKFSLPVGPLSFLTYWTFDAGVSAIVTPEEGCDMFSEKVKIRLNNYGSDPLSLVSVRYSLNGFEMGGNEPQDGLYTGVLGKDSSDVFEFDVPVGFQDPGEYLLAAYPLLKTDEDPSNDTIYQYLNVRRGLPYAQSFEIWNGGWRIDTASKRSTWAWGQPEKTGLNAAASGKNIWVTNLQGPYNFDESSYLVSPCFDFETSTDAPAFECSIFYDFEKMFDGAALEISTDGGQKWQKMGKIGSGIHWYNETNTAYALGDVWSGQSGDWLRIRHLVPEAKGKKNIRFRFRVDSDVLTTGGGLAIDDVRIEVPSTRDFTSVSANSLGDKLECGNPFDRVRLTLANIGQITADSFKVAFSINGATPVIETVKQSLLPENTLTYTFTNTFDSRDKLLNIRCWTILDGDKRQFNDTVAYQVSHLPLPAPFYADFEDGKLPNNWGAEGAITNGHGNVSQVLAVELSASNTDFITDIPRYGLIQKGDTLRFDYRITDAPSGNTAATLAAGSRVQVQVSENCGNSYETLYTINAATHQPSTLMRSINLSLDKYIGRSLYFRFAGESTSGNWFFDLDNIGLRSCPPDLKLSATVKGTWDGLPTGTATVKVGVGNPPYTYKWSNNTTTTTNTLSDLGVGEYSVTVVDAKGCSAVLPFKIGLSNAQELSHLSTLRIFPNPAQGIAHVEVAFRQSTDLQLSLFNLQGQLLWQRFIPQIAALREPIDVSSLPSGLYLLRITAEGRSVSKKLQVSGK